jgi:hypothetical protein
MAYSGTIDERILQWTFEMCQAGPFGGESLALWTMWANFIHDLDANLGAYKIEINSENRSSRSGQVPPRGFEPRS